MRKSLLLLAVLFHLQLSAQTNPQRGYILTNEGDTIRGIIDYRSDTKNALSCLFQADGATDYREYLPTDISGYRLDNGGAYYVTRTFPVEGSNQTFFAEFLIKGGISLYRYAGKADEYFYFVDSNGKVATMKSQANLYENNEQQIQVKRRSMLEATQMFAQSPSAMNSLWKSDYKAENLAKLTREYDEKYCTSEECIQYQYNARKSAYVIMHLRLEAGIALGQVTAEPFRDLKNVDTWKQSGIVPQVGIGLDMMLPRLSQNLYVQALLQLGYWNISKEADAAQNTKASSLKFINGEFDLGLAYNFMPDNKISPVLRGGIMVWKPFGKDSEGLDRYYVGSGNAMIGEQPIEVKTGFYAGAGCSFNVGEHKLTTVLNYHYRNNSRVLFKTPALSLSIGYVL